MTAIQVQGLHYSYPGGGAVIRDVSFSVAAGERVAMLGANGAGKSTLLLHLNGLLLPDAGTIMVGGTHVTKETLREVRRKVGFVFQEPDDQLFLPTLLEDVAFGPLNDGASQAEAKRGASQLLQTLGLEHVAGRAAHHLSGGEKRLASLATVLVMEPDVLVLDEPTASLDARGRRRIVELLDRREETLVLATHDLDVARALCDTAIVLADGRIAIIGPTAAIVEDPELLHRHGLLDPLEPYRG